MKSVAKAALAAGATAVFIALGPFSEEAQAEPVVSSWYGPGFEGSPTASGEPFSSGGRTAAHPSLPFGTNLLVTYGGHQTVVRVNDRGPYASGRGLDLSRGAAEEIGLTAAGADAVDVQVLGGSAGNETAPSNSKPHSSSSDRAGVFVSSNPRSSNRESDGVAGFLRERPYLRVVGATFTPHSRPSKACQEASMTPTSKEEARLPSVENTRTRVAAAASCSPRSRAL